MTVLEVVAFVIAFGGLGAGGLRWLRVAQREHYLPGSCGRFAWRWWNVRPINSVAFLIALVSIVVGVRYLPAVAIAGVITIVAPIGLSIRGRTSKLIWTPRLRRIAVLTALLVGIAVVLGSTVGSLRVGVGLAAEFSLAVPIVVDLSLVLLLPFEERSARRFVRQASDVLERVSPIVVGITGSYGKTSTKGYVAHLLEARFAVLASPKSFNNRAGLARTVNEHLVVGTDVLVAEMGTYGPGEIAEMCSWLRPKIAVITAIGPVHLERFGALEVTLESKAEITASAEIVVLNVDDERLSGLADELRSDGRRVLGCSALDPDADVALVEVDGVLSWMRRGALVAILDGSSPGLEHAQTNVAVAIAVAETLGCTDEEIAHRLGELPVAENRLSLTHASNGALILDDTFNANPAGAKIALASLASQPVARRVLVTPGMVELGPVQSDENAAFAAEAAAFVDDIVIVARTNRRALLAGARAANPDVRLHVADTRDGAVIWVRAELDGDSAVLYENDLPDHYA